MMKMILLILSTLIIMYKMNMYKYITHNYYMLMSLMILMNLNLTHSYWTKMYYIFGYDTLSLVLIILTLWIMSLSFMASNTMFTSHMMKFNMNFITMILTLMLCFLSTNLMMFYILFETSLIPMTIIILGWGMQIDRIQASMYMLFYTLVGSLPLLIMLMYMLSKNNNNNMIILLINNTLSFNTLITYLFIMSAFLIKLPIYLAHMWLPKAHVEAPICGSMILAGIMLKLGSYGIYRMAHIFKYMNLTFNYIIITISLMGSLYASLICLNQTDLKIIVAYSSIVHMNLMLASMLNLSNWSMMGSKMMMIAHGLCSSAMFCLVNFNYERLHTRILQMNKGMMNMFPSMTLWWFFICSSNFSAPPSLNLFSEMMLINGLLSWLNYLYTPIFIIIFYSTCYSMYLFSFSQHGQMKYLPPMSQMNIREFLLICLHWFPLNLLFLNMYLY